MANVIDTAIIGEDYTARVSPTDQREMQLMIANFPATLDQAIADWAKFKVGIAAGLFTTDQYQSVIDWFTKWPDYWDTIKPNFDPSIGGDMVSTHRLAVLDKANAFANRLRTAPEIQTNLGVIPLIIIAGIAIAAVLGVAGALWAVAYIRKQNNISQMIDGVVAGKIPAATLQAAIDKDNASSPFGDIASLLKWAVIGIGVIAAAPLVIDLLKGLRSKHASA